MFGAEDAIDRARAPKEAGATGVFTFEGPSHVSAPLPLTSAAGDLDLMTDVAIAFPRNPIHPALIDDEVPHTVAAGGNPAEIVAHINDHVGGVGDTAIVDESLRVRR